MKRSVASHETRKRPKGVPRLDATTVAIRLGIAVLAGLLTVLLTAVAFWLSYEHLHDVAAAHGLRDAARAWAWPATLDTFIVIGELLILRASLGRQVDYRAILLASVGSAGSITLNITGVGSDAQALDYVVAAVPPVAALFAFGALMWQIHTAIVAYTVPDETRPAKPKERPVAPAVPETLPVAPVRNAPPVPKERPVAPAVPETPVDETQTLLTVAEAAVVASQVRGETVTPSTIRTWKHRGRLSPALDGDTLFERDAVVSAATRK
jgi:uncharacterized protein DUF2637